MYDLWAIAGAGPRHQATYRITGKVESVSGHTMVLSTRSGTDVTVDTAHAAPSANTPAVGKTLSVLGQYHADGTLFAQSIFRSKSKPALWLPDR